MLGSESGECYRISVSGECYRISVSGSRWITALVGLICAFLAFGVFYATRGLVKLIAYTCRGIARILQRGFPLVVDPRHRSQRIVSFDQIKYNYVCVSMYQFIY